MIVAKIRVDGASAVATERKLITAGMVGAQVEINYADHVWDGLKKIVVFDGAETRIVVTNDSIVTIPWECMVKKNRILTVGVCGENSAGDLVIPTISAGIGVIRPAVDPSEDPSTDHTLNVWETILNMIGELDELGTDKKSSIVAAINEAMATGGGGVSFETDNTLILEDGILRVNTTDVAEKDNTLPITSAGVDTIVGNIGAILDTI